MDCVAYYAYERLTLCLPYEAVSLYPVDFSPLTFWEYIFLMAINIIPDPDKHF